MVLVVSWSVSLSAHFSLYSQPSTRGQSPGPLQPLQHQAEPPDAGLLGPVCWRADGGTALHEQGLRVEGKLLSGVHLHHEMSKYLIS